MRITERQLKSMSACRDGIDWFLDHKYRTLKTIIAGLLKEKKYSYVNWLLTNLMTHPQRIAYSIFSAELSIKNFEKIYPKDDRPRKAIEAAKAFLKGEMTIKEMKSAAWSAAYAAESAASAAYAAASAAYAASAAASAASAAYAAESAAEKDVYKKCFAYAKKLLGDK